jgi:nitrile hydratase subunit beta
MQRVHDRGGWPDAGPIDRSEHEYTLWEKRTDALMRLLTSHGVMRVDELRRAIESIDPATYEQIGYYERWITAIESLMIEKGILTHEEIELKIKEREAQARGAA